MSTLTRPVKTGFLYRLAGPLVSFSGYWTLVLLRLEVRPYISRTGNPDLAKPSLRKRPETA